MRKKTDISEIINKKLVMKAKELNPYVTAGAQLRRYAEDGRLISLGAGYYAAPSLDPLTAALAVVARYYPLAVISNVTALFVHGLTDERIDQIDVDIPRESSIRNKLLRTHRVNSNLIKGVEEATYNGIRLKVYSKERALCDAYKIDPDGSIFLKAFKRYAKAGAVDADAIATYDKLLKTNVLRSVMQEFADE